MKTWWVEYKYTYEYLNETGEFEPEEDFDAGRFTCLKRNIKKTVFNEIEDYLNYSYYGGIKNLKIEIIDCYETIEYEI